MNTLRMKYLLESIGFQITKRITVACLAIVTVLFATAMSIHPIRAAFWEAVLTWYEDYIAIRMEKDPEVDYPKFIEERILPENIPEGWRIEVVGENKVNGMYEIYGTEEENIIYEQMVFTGRGVWYDNTDCIIDKVLINGNTTAYLLTYLDGDIALHWVDRYEFSLFTENSSQEQLIKIAEDIIQ